jgi:hypothetical protein
MEITPGAHCMYESPSPSKRIVHRMLEWMFPASTLVGPSRPSAQSRATSLSTSHIVFMKKDLSSIRFDAICAAASSVAMAPSTSSFMRSLNVNLDIEREFSLEIWRIIRGELSRQSNKNFCLRPAASLRLYSASLLRPSTQAEHLILLVNLIQVSFSQTSSGQGLHDPSRCELVQNAKKQLILG